MQPISKINSAPLPQTAGAEPKKIRISHLGQDVEVLPVDFVEIDGTGLQPGLKGPRVHISEPAHISAPQPDHNGNYLYDDPSEPRFDAVVAYQAITSSIDLAQSYLGRPLPFGFAKETGRDHLIVHPHAGEQVNAFYDSGRGSINLFTFPDERGNILRMAQMPDVVKHESGHAILDGLRREYINSPGPWGIAFHEAFGDITAMLGALHDPKVVDLAKAQCKGDLRNVNALTRWAEKLGKSKNAKPTTPVDEAFMRQGLNHYELQDWHFMPYLPTPGRSGGMAIEPHAMSQVFTGAFYDIISKTQKSYPKEISFEQSLAETRDMAGQLLHRAVEFGPVANPTFEGIALAFLKADQIDFGGKNRKMLEEIFKARTFLSDADLKKFDQEQKALPKLRLKCDVSEAAPAEAFLKATAKLLGLPASASEMKHVSTVTGGKGETIVSYLFKKPLDLMGPEFGNFEGSRLMVPGGLLLVFNKEGQLIVKDFQDVGTRELDNARDFIKIGLANNAFPVTSALGSSADSGNSAIQGSHGHSLIQMTCQNGLLTPSGTICC